MSPPQAPLCALRATALAVSPDEKAATGADSGVRRAWVGQDDSGFAARWSRRLRHCRTRQALAGIKGKSMPLAPGPGARTHSSGSRGVATIEPRLGANRLSDGSATNPVSGKLRRGCDFRICCRSAKRRRLDLISLLRSGPAGLAARASTPGYPQPLVNKDGWPRGRWGTRRTMRWVRARPGGP